MNLDEVIAHIRPADPEAKRLAAADDPVIVYRLSGPKVAKVWEGAVVANLSDRLTVQHVEEVTV